MGSAAAERQRRYRAHNRGDHSLCLPERDCRAGSDTVTSPVTATVTRDEPTRGRRLWDDMGGDALTGGRRVLLEEACRIADRLDRLDAILAGSSEDWLSFVETKGMPDRQEIVIDKPLAEARQQATALKQLIAELRQGESAGGEQDQGGSILDELAAARAKRLADAAGS